MISPFYVALGAFVLIILTLNVILLRRNELISLGDGGNKALLKARSAHSNATETLPICLLLLVTLELNLGPLWMIHALGLLLIAGRVLHAFGLLNSILPLRISGMALTVTCLLVLGILNLMYLPWAVLIV